MTGEAYDIDMHDELFKICSSRKNNWKLFHRSLSSDLLNPTIQPPSLLAVSLGKKSSPAFISCATSMQLLTGRESESGKHMTISPHIGQIKFPLPIRSLQTSWSTFICLGDKIPVLSCRKVLSPSCEFSLYSANQPDMQASKAEAVITSKTIISCQKVG